MNELSIENLILQLKGQKAKTNILRSIANVVLANSLECHCEVFGENFRVLIWPKAKNVPFEIYCENGVFRYENIKITSARQMNSLLNLMKLCE